ncbi:MAG: hypothetical protein ACLP4R_01715 [Solirubrobacteraceae bacterium]
MSTPQTIVTPRLRIRPGKVVTALGVLVAIAVTIVILALTGTHHTTVTTPARTSQPVTSATPQTHYVGPRQQQAPTNTHGAASAASAGPAPHYICLGAARRCLR